MLTILCVSGIAARAGLRRLLSGAGIAAAISLSAVVALFPFSSGLSLSGYVLSLNPGFSVGSIALLFTVLWKRFGGAPLLSERDLLLFSAWNAAAGTCLYISYLGFAGPDVYAFGFGFSMLFVLTAVLTILLVLFRSALSYIFISYIIAFDLKVLYSENFFDYMMDGVLFFVSVGILISFTVRSAGAKGGRCRACDSGVPE